MLHCLAHTVAGCCVFLGVVAGSLRLVKVLSRDLRSVARQCWNRTRLHSSPNIVGARQPAYQRCVAMSLCSLAYNHKQGISYDLVKIMKDEHQLYSSLCQSVGKSFLMPTELPIMLNAADRTYIF